MLFRSSIVDLNVGVFSVVSEVSEIVFNSIHSFFFILLLGSYFHYFVFQLNYSFFCLSYSVIDPSRVFFISVIVLFISICLFFSSSRSLFNISCIFSVHASILFLRFWIIFTIITLNSFSGRLSISSSLIWSCRFLPYFFICDIFFCPLSFFFYESYCVPV